MTISSFGCAVKVSAFLLPLPYFPEPEYVPVTILPAPSMAAVILCGLDALRWEIRALIAVLTLPRITESVSPLMIVASFELVAKVGVWLLVVTFGTLPSPTCSAVTLWGLFFAVV